MTQWTRENSRAFMPYPDCDVPHAESGPLAGLTFSVKDMFDVAGFPTSAGSPTMLAASGIKTKTACAVQQLLDAGARFIGKAVTDELAFSVIGNNAHFGIPVNGAAPERYAGGSSSGSASSVSCGLCDFSLGTDSGGGDPYEAPLVNAGCSAFVRASVVSLWKAVSACARRLTRPAFWRPILTCLSAQRPF